VATKGMTKLNISNRGSWGEADVALVSSSSISSGSARVRVAVRALSVDANRAAGVTTLLLVEVVVLDS